MIATDVYRPAAIEQLVTLGKQIGVPVFEMGTDARPADIARKGIEMARKVHCQETSDTSTSSYGRGPLPHQFDSAVDSRTGSSMTTYSCRPYAPDKIVECSILKTYF